MSVSAKITNSSIKALKPENKRINDTEIKGFHARIYASGKINYYLYYRINGKQVNFHLGTHGKITPATARELAQVKAGEVAKGIDVQEHKKTLKAEADRERSNKLDTFLVKKYEPWLYTRNSKTSGQIVQRLRSAFSDFLSLPLADITAWRVEKWRSHHKKQGMAAATINYYVSTLKGALSRAVEWGLIEEHDLRKVKQLKVDNSITNYLSKEQEQKLLEALEQRNNDLISARESANHFREVRGYELLPDFTNQRFADHLYPIVILAMNTGMRRGEILQLRWSDINFPSSSLIVRGGNAKSGKGRHIPLNDKAKQALVDWRTPQQSEWVFPGKNGNPITDFKKSWQNIVELTGLSNFRFHDLRHHFASKLVMAGVDLNTVRELLGHSDIKMTLRYAHLAPEHKASAVSLL